MSGFPPALDEHLAREVTTMCHCWRLTRRDGAVLGFTDHDRRLAVDGTLFQPESGLTASEARDTLGLAVDTVDVEGALSAASISEADIAAGLFDGATVETLLVNWRSPAEFALIRRAVVGKITRADNRFVAELESAAQALDRPNGRVVSRRCDAEVGDMRCGVDLHAAGYRSSAVVDALRPPDGLAVSGLDGFASGWFAQGMFTWTSGARAGRSERVVDHRSEAGAVVLVLEQGASGAAAGDSFSVTAGCDKSFGTCKAKFANRVNFRGFPHLPGNDAAYGYVTDGDVFDGGPLVP